MYIFEDPHWVICIQVIKDKKSCLLINKSLALIPSGDTHFHPYMVLIMTDYFRGRDLCHKKKIDKHMQEKILSF